MLKPVRFPSLLLAVLMAVSTLLVACGKKDPQMMLHGEKSKKWVTEDEQTWTFGADGTYTQATSVDEQTGKYRYDDATKTMVLSMPMGDAPPFNVTMMSDEQLTLTAANGAEIKLKAAAQQ